MDRTSSLYSPAYTPTHNKCGLQWWLKTKEPPWGLPEAHCNADKHVCVCVCVCVFCNEESRGKKEETEQQWLSECVRLARFRVPQCHCDTHYSRYEAALVCRSHTLVKWRAALQYTHTHTHTHTSFSPVSMAFTHLFTHYKASTLGNEVHYSFCLGAKIGRWSRIPPYIIKIWFYHVLSH